MEQGFYRENSTVYYYKGHEIGGSAACYEAIGYDFDSNIYKHSYPIPKLRMFKNKPTKIEIEQWTKRMEAIEFLEFTFELNEDNRKYAFNAWEKGLDYAKELLSSKKKYRWKR